MFSCLFCCFTFELIAVDKTLISLNVFITQKRRKLIPNKPLSQDIIFQVFLFTL